MHNQKDRVKTIHKKNRVREIQCDQSFHKKLAGLEMLSSSTQKTQLTSKKRSSKSKRLRSFESL